MALTAKSFEIFSGTGGVGKTTLATSRAIEIAKSGKTVLLITIDPAKRLRELLSLDLECSGDIVHVKDPFSELPEDQELPLYVELMNPSKTFQRIAKKNNCEEVLTNRILSILTKPYGGLNEILAIVELNIQYNSKRFDVIVLDTPPGGHFLDFLDSVEKIRIFFDQSFIDIFNYLGKKIDYPSLSLGKRFMNIIVSSGIKKLLGYLNKVTGDKFIHDFIDAIIAIYKTKSSFLDALNLQEMLKSQNNSTWFLVTSVEQNKLKEALELHDKAKGLMNKKSFILLNKCIERDLERWSPKENTQELLLKESLLQREKALKSSLQKLFEGVLEFPEVYHFSPLEHVKELTHVWKNISFQERKNGTV